MPTVGDSGLTDSQKGATICERPGSCLPEPFQKLLAKILSMEYGEVVFVVTVQDRVPIMLKTIEGLDVEFLRKTTHYKLV